MGTPRVPLPGLPQIEAVYTDTALRSVMRKQMVTGVFSSVETFLPVTTGGSFVEITVTVTSAYRICLDS